MSLLRRGTRRGPILGILLSGTSVTSPTVADAVPTGELSPLRTGRLLFDTSPAEALPIAASFTQEAQVESMHSSQLSPTIPDAPSISGKPLARPATLRVETSRDLNMLV